jgi:hypothetical protein
MSFINTGMKPKLVENKIVEKIIKVQQENKPYNLKIWNNLYSFIFNNLFVISIFTFIFLLLLYRYYDVQSRKKKTKKRKEYDEDEDDEDKDDKNEDTNEESNLSDEK